MDNGVVHLQKNNSQLFCTFSYLTLQLNLSKPTSVGPTFLFSINRYLVYTGEINKISYIGTLFMVQFIRDSGLFTKYTQMILK